MLVQHGVRHLLWADGHTNVQKNDQVPLLDIHYPFPTLPTQNPSPTIDLTPVQTTVSVSAGQVVTIGSLDRSIRLHHIELTVRPPTTARAQSTDQMWFDVAHVNSSAVNTSAAVSAAKKPHSPLPSTSKTKQLSSTDKIKPLPTPEAARRFQLPFFRQGNVYQRTLIRQLIASDQLIAIYGDPANSQHTEAAKAIQNCGMPSVLHFISQSIGQITDFDHDGRLALVLGQLADPLPAESDEQPIRGCVRPADFQNGSPTCVDAIYLDPIHLKTSELRSLLAHECAHAATFSLLVKSGQSPTEMPSWLNEAIAHLIEQQIAPQSENLHQRRLRFQAKPWLYPSVIPKEFTSIALRRGPSRIASLELLQSTFDSNSNPNLKALIQERGDGINRLLTVNKTDFPKLFRRFSQHLVQQLCLPASQQNDRPAKTDGIKGANNTSEQQRFGAFGLSEFSDQSIQIRGTSVAISSPATLDCQLVITTTRDALPQITVIDATQ